MYRIHRKFDTRSFGTNILPVDSRARLTCLWIAHSAQNPAVRPSCINFQGKFQYSEKLIEHQNQKSPYMCIQQQSRIYSKISIFIS